MKISFLILHYKNISETIECVESILKNVNYDNYDIIIVDNGSNNDTGEILKEKYNKNKKIEVIISKTNLGFANGNNLGFKYIKDNINSDFIVMINSDTIIEQGNFCQILIDEYKQKHFHVCGIDITLPEGTHTNPTIPSVNNVEDIKRIIKSIKRDRLICNLNLGMVDTGIKRICSKFNKNKRIIDYDKEILDCINENVQLHGAALIFSRLFIEKYDGLYDGTFLYFEEVALRYIAERDNLKLMYIPSIKIIHKMSKTTKSLYKNWKIRHLFNYNNMINSATNLLKYIEESNYNTWKKDKI
jgi:GT2 family glycosyltransferase